MPPHSNPIFLAFDRRIPCNYEYLREKERAFSTGRLRILEAL